MKLVLLQKIDMRKITDVKSISLCVKNCTQLFKFSLKNLEYWRVEVESIGTKVKSLKSRNIFSIFILRKQK